MWVPSAAAGHLTRARVMYKGSVAISISVFCLACGCAALLGQWASIGRTSICKSARARAHGARASCDREGGPAFGDEVRAAWPGGSAWLFLVHPYIVSLYIPRAVSFSCYDPCCKLVGPGEGRPRILLFVSTMCFCLLISRLPIFRENSE